MESNVKFGHENHIGPNCIIIGNVTIGTRNKLHSNVIIGTAAEHRDYGNKPRGEIHIGDNNIFHDRVIIHSPCITNFTKIGSECMVMSGVNIAHDNTIEDQVTLSSGVILAGCVTIHKGSNLGMGTTVHQSITIGEGVMTGMGTVVNRNIPPFLKVAGNPVRILGVNEIGMKRSGFNDFDIESVKGYYNHNLKLKNASYTIRKIIQFETDHPDYLTVWK